MYICAFEMYASADVVASSITKSLHLLLAENAMHDFHVHSTCIVQLKLSLNTIVLNTGHASLR